MKVGIVGAGQLGTLLAESVLALGGEVSFYDEDPDAPALARYRGGVVGRFDDAAALAEFAASCDVVTYEFEHIAPGPLRAFAGKPPVLPSVDILEMAQDRAREKAFLRDHGLPHVRYAHVPGLDALPEAAAAFGLPFVLKTTRGGYDGKGQYMVDSAAALGEAIRLLAGYDGALVLEERVDLLVEVSCLVARDAAGAELVFPVLENAHHDHILDMTVLPARIEPALASAVAQVALDAARAMGLVGLLTTEFFVARSPGRSPTGIVTPHGVVYVNEFAPRPHNSGHVTRSACTPSQYEALARVLLGIPLPTTAAKLLGAEGCWCMGNLLGDVWLDQGGGPSLDLSAWRDHPAVVDVVLYGKRVPKAKRKMGHFVAWAEDAERVVAAARAFREALRRR